MFERSSRGEGSRRRAVGRPTAHRAPRRSGHRAARVLAVLLPVAAGALLAPGPAAAQPRVGPERVVTAAIRATATGEPTGATGSEGPTVTTAAGERYRAGAFHRWFLGRHHRDAWTRALRVPVLELDRMAGGLTPIRTGGGMQTRSLRFRGADGREYTFRSVDKDPSAILDPLLRETVVADLVQDGISAAHPFAALVAAALLDAVGVLHVEPRLRVMPDDPALGDLREEFAGMLGLIEEHPDENDGGPTAFRGAENVVGSERLTERLDEGPDDRVDAREYLRARLVDVFLGDWDRHRGQWRWATFDAKAPRRWLPVPRDRDQAFSTFDGAAPRMVSLYVPQLVRFEPEYPSIIRLHWNARALDRRLLSELDRAAWEEVGAEVRSALTDEVIEEAVLRLPPEIHAIDGVELASTLKLRRDALPDAWSELYETMSDVVDVRATDADEIISIERTGPGSLTITVSVPDERAGPHFVRRFAADETAEVRVHLRGGDDQVVVSGAADPGIVVRVVGGEGDDRYLFEGYAAGIHLYDQEGDDTVFGEAAPRIDDRPFEEWEWSSDDPDQPRDWGRRTLPIFWSSYASDVGLFVGGGARLERYGFRQRPYALRFDLRAGYAPNIGKGRVEVDGRINRPGSPLFWTVGARVSGLDVLHYYGLGNQSPPGGEGFHRVDLARASAAVGLGFSPGRLLELTATAQVERSRTRSHPTRFFASLGGLYGDDAFTALGIGTRLVIDPLGGRERVGHRLRLTLDGTLHPSAFDVESTFGRARGGLSFLIASSPSPAISLAGRVDAEQVFGRFPWHQAAFIGGEGTVRGWNDQRFAGDAGVHGSGELRVRVSGPRAVVPATVGVFGFGDIGRVYFDGESPGGWHAGVGGGVHLQPVGRPHLVKLGAARSAESTKVFLTVGLPY